MDPSATQPEQTDDHRTWQYGDDVFPLIAPTPLLNTWKLFEAWLRILQLFALCGVLAWSVASLPEVIRNVHRANLYRHIPALTHLHSAAAQTKPNAAVEPSSGAMQTLRPADSPKAYCVAISEYLADSRTTSDWLALVCLPCLSFGSAVGVVVSLICLPASRWRALGLGMCNGAVTMGWLLLTTTPRDRSEGAFQLFTPGQEWGIAIDLPVYEKLMYAWTINDLPAATLSMTLGLLIAIWFARPITRFVMRLLLPPASRWHIAWLWTADGLRVPGAQRSSS